MTDLPNYCFWRLALGESIRRFEEAGEKVTADAHNLRDDFRSKRQAPLRGRFAWATAAGSVIRVTNCACGDPGTP
jgi:hypothetical protein